MRIAFAGFQHETNTFAPGRAGMEAFRMADSWPPLLSGAAAEEGLRGLNIPMAGALAEARARGVETIPILWCAAEPSGPVADDAFDRITGMIIDGLSAAGPLDGVCLDLHGAMVTESHEDGEGALLSRIRDHLGPQTPITVSLDLHANVTPLMARLADRISIFRTYPHLDMAETGARSLRWLTRLIERAAGPAAAFRQAPFLIPLHAQCTDAEPCRSLYAALVADGAQADDVEGVELALGFTAADIRDCGPSILAYAADPARAAALADAALGRLEAAEPAFDVALSPPEAAVRRAMASRAPGPVILADVQDNPGAGGSSDTNGLLRALVAEGARGAVSGLHHDPPIAAAAHRAGPGAVVEGALGGRSGVAGDAPFEGAFRVLALHHGRIPYGGEMYRGGVAEIGPSCLLRLEGVEADVSVAVSSARCQCLDQAFFAELGARPEERRIICVKSTVHFRADFDPIASEVIAVAAPGAFPCDLGTIGYRALRPGVRRGPRRPAG